MHYGSDFAVGRYSIHNRYRKIRLLPGKSPETIASLDEKKQTVMELTAASTVTSALITLLPGDTATPIAEKMADVSGYLLVVLCAIYLEKYLVTITGYVAFTYLIPIACGLWIFNLILQMLPCENWQQNLQYLALPFFSWFRPV